MYEDKTLVCKECGNEFVFTAGEQEFYAEKVLKMSHRDVRLAVMQEKMLLEAKDKCIQQYVLHVAEKLKFLSSQEKTDLYIAVNVLLS